MKISFERNPEGFNLSGTTHLLIFTGKLGTGFKLKYNKNIYTFRIKLVMHKTSERLADALDKF